MNAFGLQNNRFHKKASQKLKNKRDQPNSINEKLQIENLVYQKNSESQADLDTSYSNLRNDQENSNSISIPKSINMDLIIRLNEKYQRKSFQ